MSITVVKPALVVKTDDTGHVEIDGVRVNVRELYERDMTSKRSAKKTCPREDAEVPPVLSCSGVAVRGVRITAEHDAPSELFGHDQSQCDRGLARCRQSKCSWCANLVNNINNRRRVAANAHLSDDDIRINTPIKTCSSCKIEQPSDQFPINRATVSGLMAYCRSCKNDSSRRTTTAETQAAARHRRRDRESGIDFPTGDWALLVSVTDATCYSCGVRCRTDVEATHDQKLTLGHVIPLSRGGTNAIENLQPQCRRCNHGVGGQHSKLLGEWLSGIRLLIAERRMAHNLSKLHAAKSDAASAL